MLSVATVPVSADDLFERDRITGDWGGLRSLLADHGISFSGNWTQFLQAIVAGDATTDALYGGYVQGTLTVDGTKAGLIPGLTFDAAFEGHYGKTVNGRGGTIVPPNFPLNIPTAGNDVFGLDRFRLTQQLGHGVSVYVGKFTPLYGFQQEFIDGRGLTKLLNTAFTAKPVLGGSVSYSAWMTGINWNIVPSAGPHDRGLWLKFFIQDSNNVPTRWGFDTLFDNGFNVLGELDFPTSLFGLPGNHIINVAWSNRKRTSLDIDEVVILPGGGFVPGTLNRTWAAYYTFDQYLYLDPMDLSRGWGIFGKVEFSDADPNPIALAAAFGFGGTGPFDARPADKWGLGGYLVQLSDTLEKSLSGIVSIRNELGFEGFYSFALTPAIALSIDGQLIHPITTSRDWQGILGLRLNIVL